MIEWNFVGEAIAVTERVQVINEIVELITEMADEQDVEARRLEKQSGRFAAFYVSDLARKYRSLAEKISKMEFVSEEKKVV